MEAGSDEPRERTQLPREMTRGGAEGDEMEEEE